MGSIYLVTGEGIGKTTSSLGVCMRAVGHNQKALIIQFLKGRKDIGEFKIQEKLKEFYTVKQFGSPDFINPKNISEKNKILANEGLKYANKILKEGKTDLLVLDEINIAVAWKLLNVKDVLDLLKKIPEKTTVFLTGRYAPKELIDRADFASVIKQKKVPNPIPGAKKGVQF